MAVTGGRHLNFLMPGSEADWLFIPPAARQWDFSSYKLSGRLQNILGAAGIVRLGDLNGLQRSQLLRRRNWGRLAALELLGLVRHVQHGNWHDHSPRKPAPAGAMDVEI